MQAKHSSVQDKNNVKILKKKKNNGRRSPGLNRNSLKGNLELRGFVNRSCQLASPLLHTLKLLTIFAFLSHGFELVSGRDSVGTGDLFGGKVIHILTTGPIPK